MIHVGDVRTYQRLPPVRKLLTLVFGLVAKDRANELRFDYRPDPPEARMWFSAAGVPWEMVPPPGHLWPELFRLLWRETRFDPPNRTHWWQRRARRPAFPECPAAGTLTVRFANIPVEFDIIFFRGPTGEHILLRKVSAVNVSPAVADFFSSHVNKR